MKTSLQKELPIIAIVLLPFIYLAYLWSDLPEKIPMHWDLEGNVNRYGNKTELLFLLFLLPLLTYLIFLAIPYLDPKDKIKNMGRKYHNLKLFMTLLMSIMALFILHTSTNQSLESPVFIITLIGILFMILGNYFKTIQPNYFIGIKTPWTLENETVWKNTHKIAGKLWVIGGLIIVFVSIILNHKTAIIVTVVTTFLIALSPIIYSYFEFKKQTQS